MATPDIPVLSRAVSVPVENGQVYLGDLTTADVGAAEAAFDDAVGSGRFVGTAGGIVDIVTPAEDSPGTPFTVEVWPGEPAGDLDDWDHEVDLDLDLPSGRLGVDILADPVGEVPVAPGRYRIRVSGRGFTLFADRRGEPVESFRIRVWPRGDDTPPTLRKNWPGWVDWQ